MSTWFYYDNDGQKQGPVSGGRLKGLAKAGLITPGTMVESEGGKTAPAIKIKGLTFVTSEVAASETAPPETTQPVETDIYDLVPPEPEEAIAEPNPFSAAPPVVENPFIAPFVTTPPVVENPFTAPMPDERYEDMPEAIHAETMNVFTSIMMLVLALILCCVVGWIMLWLWSVMITPSKVADPVPAVQSNESGSDKPDRSRFNQYYVLP
jgi:hypothetical protein